MRIGLLTTSFPRFDGDVAGHFVLGFARALAARGHELDVLAPEPSELREAPCWLGVRVHWVPYLRPKGLQQTFYGAGVPDNLRRAPAAWLGALPFVAALWHAARCRNAGWDAVVSHFGVPCGLVGALLRRRLERSHLAVLHSADVHWLSRSPGRAALAQLLVAGSDRLSFVSLRHREQFLACLAPEQRAPAAEACVVQPMGFERAGVVDRDRARLRSELGLSRFTLLTVARLVPVKGLAQAIAELQGESELEWLIAGDGPERAALRALAERAKLRVRLLGPVTRIDKQALLQAADAFVLPSRVLGSGRTEGAPTALLEAMDAGLPVLASEVGGIGELIEHERTGLLVDPGERGALGRALRALRASPDRGRAMGERARAAVQRYEWSELAPRFEGLLTAGPTSRRDESLGAAAIRTASPARRY